MSAGVFENLFPPTLLTGDLSTEVLDPHGITPPVTIIRTSDLWKVKADWYIQGPAAPLISGKWTWRVFAESIGAGPELELGKKEVPVDVVWDLVTLRRDYPDNTIDVTAGTLPAGVYRLVSVLNYANMGVPLEIAGFVEGPVVQIYDA